MSASIIPFQIERPAVRFRESKATPGSRVVPDEVVRRAEALFQDSRAYRDDDLHMADRWKSMREWYLSTGRSWLSGLSSNTYVNLIRSNVDALHASLTDPSPEFRFRAPEPDSVGTVDYLNRAVRPAWIEERGPTKYRSTVKGDVIFGTWFHKITHEPGRDGRGPRARIREVPCYRIFPSPYAGDVESAPWMIEVMPRSVEEIERDTGVRVMPELEPDADFPDVAEDLDEVRGRSGGIRGQNVGLSSQSATASTLFPSTYLFQGSGKPAGIAFQKELWIHDSTEESRYWVEKMAGGLLSDVQYGKASRYPMGRVISWANGVRLYDRPAPYRAPYVRYADQVFPGLFWGLGEIPGLIKLQLLHDDMVDTMRLIHAYMANGRLIVDKRTGLKDRELGNDPGEVWRVNPGTADGIRWLPGLTPPGEFYTHIDKIEDWFDQVTRRTEVTRGMTPPNTGSGRAIGLLQSAAETTVRARLRDLEDSVREEAQMMAERVLSFGPASARLEDPETGIFGEVAISKEDRIRPFSTQVDIVANLDELKAREFEKTALLHGQQLMTDERYIRLSGHSATQELLAELPALKRQQAMAAMAAAAVGDEGAGPTSPGPSPTAAAAQQKTGEQRAINKTLRPRRAG